MTDHTAVGVRVALNTSFHAARAQLKILARGGTLPRASEVAYGEGIGLAELADPAAGLTRLADVCLEDLTETDDCAHIALQCEAIAADGKLFTVLLADLMLIPAGDQITALSVTGTYWPALQQKAAVPQVRQGDRSAALRRGLPALPTRLGCFLQAVVRL